jgi:histidyl-tRNA synthetase
VCLRPELTAGIVRAYTAATAPPGLPWRVSHSGPVFRYESPRPDRLREFHQVGVERLGDSGPLADGEVIWLADWVLAEAGVTGAKIRLGHVGLILEILDRSGLPSPHVSALIEMLSEAAAEGGDVRSIESALERLSGWLQTSDTGEIPTAVDRADDAGIDRLFRTLVPIVTGRRAPHEIVHRLRRKWDLGHGLLGALDGVRRQLHELADLRGPAPVILERLLREFRALAPDSVDSLVRLAEVLRSCNIDLDRVELDLGFGRGIGFYSRMIFELIVPTPAGPVEVCGGGRYDGLARVLGSDRDDQGVGFAFGLERLARVLDAQGQRGNGREPSGFLVLAGKFGAIEVAAVATSLRSLGVRAVAELGTSGGTAIARAKSLGLSRVVTLLDAPDARHAFRIQDVRDGTERDVSGKELGDIVRAEAEGARR